MVVTELREACAAVAAQAVHVRVNVAAIPAYAAALPGLTPPSSAVTAEGDDARPAAWYWLTMDAINFGSGWFPTLVKAPGRSGYQTISTALGRHFAARGHWSAPELESLGPADLAAVLGQDPAHPLMALFATSLNDLGAHLGAGHHGDPLALVDAAGGSAARLIEILAGWSCFNDVSDYAGISVPFNKRAQITAADLARAGVAAFGDLETLTMFADNLVPHVLRLDGILDFAPDLIARIDAGELIGHGSREEVEIRAGAVHAVELILAAGPPGGDPRPGRGNAAQLDQLLWERGQAPAYKARPRHRSRCTAY